MDGFVYFSFLQGVLAFFAPCAVALLPAYIFSFISKNSELNSNKIFLLFRGLKLATLSIVGIFVIYTIATVLIIVANELIKEYMKYIATLLGVLLVILGGLMAYGKNISLNLHIEQKSYNSEVKEAFFFGVAYAIGALGCLFPLFLIVATQALGQTNALVGASYVIAYFMGISLLMFITIIGSIFAKDFINRKIRSILPHMQKMTAVLLLIEGAYVIYY